MAEEKGLHDGHRKRVKERFISEGLDKFQDHQILELLLFYAVPRKDTNELAHTLLNKFRSLSGVMDAPIEVLQENGLSENAAVLIKLIPSVCSAYLKDKYTSAKKYPITQENIGEFILPFFVGIDNEQVLLLLFDAKGNVRYCDVVSKGSINASDLSIKKIANIAAKFNMSSAVIAHNHPSGIAMPSNADIKTTIKLKNSLRAVGVVLLDHIIVANMTYMSMANSEEYEEIFM